MASFTHDHFQTIRDKPYLKKKYNGKYKEQFMFNICFEDTVLCFFFLILRRGERMLLSSVLKSEVTFLDRLLSCFNAQNGRLKSAYKRYF